ncbi:LysR family transcriptional regulator [Nocardiopsis chromatogenes]|uniref:LysR family transcriptional regulator n=1 Tax=Nocardiopsis chromatogenes TaxID=280239 RepID=UPI00373AE795
MQNIRVIDPKLKVLQMVARYGTVTAAAQAMSYTPSAVSYQLRQLAEGLGGGRAPRLGPRSLRPRNVPLLQGTPRAARLLGPQSAPPVPRIHRVMSPGKAASVQPYALCGRMR